MSESLSQLNQSHTAMKRIAASYNKSCSTAVYLELLVFLSRTVGAHQIPVNEVATHQNEVVDPDAVHYDLVKKIARTLYRANRCFHVSAPIRFDRTFDALGLIHKELAESERTDIDQMNLLHDIGVSTRKYFESKTSSPVKPKTSKDHQPNQKESQNLYKIAGLSTFEH